MTQAAYQQASQQQSVTGTVASVNPKGLKLDGEGEWRNFSKFSEVAPPERGQVVTLTLDRQGFVRGIESSGAQSPVRGQHDRSELRELRIIRQSVLRTAGEFCASRTDLRSSDLILLAERMEAWVLRDEE